MVKETLPEEKIDEFVNDELSFVGSPFVGAYNPIDFLFSKYRMPEYGFTCVGLVWYCAKRVLDIDISIPMLPSIMPVNAICTPYTDIVTIVQ